MIVRRVQPQDYQAMESMARDFVAAHPHGMGFDEGAFAAMFDKALEGHSLAFFVALDGGVAAGMLGGIHYPMYFNPADTVAQELFWWVDAPYRGTQAGRKLLDAFEEWAHRHGAGRCMTSAMENDRIAAVNRLYQRMGYTPTERVYYKEIA